MAKFVKDILKVGRFLTRDLFTGDRVEKEFTEADLQHYATEAQRSIALGLPIPAPWDHDDSTPVNVSAKNNAGFWEHIWYDETTKYLKGIVSIPIAEDASKVGTTVKEVSPAIAPFYEDGDGNSWNNAITHVGLVLRAVQHGQDNFVPLEKTQHTTPAIALSLYDEILSNVRASGNASGTNNNPTTPEEQRKAQMKKIIDILKKVGLNIGDDTTPETLAQRIELVGEALTSNGILSNPNLGKELDNTLALDLNSPHPVVRFAVRQAQESYKRRIENLVKTGRISPKYVKDSLEPMFNTLALSLDAEGNPKGNTNLDIVLQALELQPEHSTLQFKQTRTKAKADKQGEKQGQTLGLSLGMELELEEEHEDRQPTEDEINKVTAEFLRSQGRQELSGCLN